MVLQTEDCIDVVLRACFDGMYEYYFLFDHSSGHDAKQRRIDGLDATKMNQNFGGSQK
jgi:hypothetical protein